MRKLTMTALIAATFAMSPLIHIPTAAADSFSFSFNPDDVAFAYSDGYWDHNHHWHKWHNRREAHEFQSRYADHYHNWRHTRDHDKGWHDEGH